MGVNGDLAGGAMSDFFLHGGAFEVTRSRPHAFAWVDTWFGTLRKIGSDHRNALTQKKQKMRLCLDLIELSSMAIPSSNHCSFTYIMDETSEMS
ncbi:unnamed protein product [Brassica napus]|uniref:(rape) hypothetical protein n=1 Tax=Brassica napus TaxID=3708 RepID=A0A816W9W6_BRANA|nr:unnamed protein product [Brassica napus]